MINLKQKVYKHIHNLCFRRGFPKAYEQLWLRGFWGVRNKVHEPIRDKVLINEKP